jgi:endonuclease/exonuclease/phosphatase family metal-dependent hydrolase
MDSGHPPTFRLKVLTVNIHKGFSIFNRKFILHELREAVRAASADIVFLQEVHGTHEGHSLRVLDWPPAPHYEFLADSIWPAFAYGRNAVYPHGDHGNALLSKFPIGRYRNYDVSITGAERRGMLHCVLELPPPGGALHAICVHLGLAGKHRRNQISDLCRMVLTEVPDGEPIVVAGDFNDWQRHAHDLLRDCAGMREVFVQANGRAANTFPARWPLLPLDRIYVKNVTAHAPIELPRRPWSHLSDHRPLAAEIRL